MTTEKEQILKSIETKIDQMTRLTEEIMTDIWNGAIEEAAECVGKCDADTYGLIETIRKLKK